MHLNDDLDKIEVMKNLQDKGWKGTYNNNITSRERVAINNIPA